MYLLQVYLPALVTHREAWERKAWERKAWKSGVGGLAQRKKTSLIAIFTPIYRQDCLILLVVGCTVLIEDEHNHIRWLETTPFCAQVSLGTWTVGN
jgi:hypothetical protein